VHTRVEPEPTDAWEPDSSDDTEVAVQSGQDPRSAPAEGILGPLSGEDEQANVEHRRASRNDEHAGSSWSKDAGQLPARLIDVVDEFQSAHRYHRVE